MDRMISPDHALELVLEHTPAPRQVTCPLEQALGRVLDETIRAEEDFPRFVRAMMDGFAVCVADAGREAEVVDQVAAGHTSSCRIEPGRCAEIMTGAPCPPGTEAVVMVEHTERVGNRVKLPAAVKPGQHVQAIGELCRKGTVTLTPGAEISPLVVGHLAALDRRTVKVRDLPAVAVISTGDELVPVGAPLQDGQIRDSNGPMLVALSRQVGVVSVLLLHARDTEESLRKTLRAAQDADFVVLTGGVSMGKFDLVPRMVEAMGAAPVFHKATQKPGKPLLLATGQGRLLFGLPGNARSTHFCFTRYVAPALRRFMGHAPAIALGTGRLAQAYACKSNRTLFVPMRADPDDTGGWHLQPLTDQGSADIYNVARANVYARFEPGEHHLDAGTPLPFHFMNPCHG